MYDQYEALARASEFARISRELHAEPGTQPTLDRIVQLAVESIPACEHCGVSLRHKDNTVETPASTSDVVEKADALQYEYGEGPCLDAIWSLDLLVIDDLQARDPVAEVVAACR